MSNKTQIELTPEQAKAITEISIKTDAANTTFNQAYVVHTITMEAIKKDQKTLWDNLCQDHNLDRNAPWKIETIDNKLYIVEHVVEQNDQ